jgi:hypothetical protein
MTASQNGTAPQIDARDLMSARKRAFAAATRACGILAEAAGADSATLANGGVPDAAAFRKLSEKYLARLDMLGTMDSLLTPEALEAMHLEHEQDVLDYPGWRQDLALLTDVIPGVAPGASADINSPLGRLTRAAHPGRAAAEMAAELAAAVSVPDPGFPPQGS